MNRQPMTAEEARAVAQILQNFSVPQTRSQQPREYSRPATRSEQIIHESIKNGTFESWSDRTQPLPAGVDVESMLKDLSNLYYNEQAKR